MFWVGFFVFSGALGVCILSVLGFRFFRVIWVFSMFGVLGFF